MRFQFGSNYTDGMTCVAPVEGVYNATTNDSDKTFTVPDGEMWKILSADIVLVTTATVGNRQIRFSVSNPDGNVMGYIPAGTTQAASLTRSYGFMQGIYRETAFIDGMIQVPIPVDLYLPAGSTIRFYDSAAIDAAADDMTVAFSYQLFKGC